ncbi:hypothetical protein AB205_0111970 [Aquarana catesbeiana]|uniref:Adhesion G protein-coupled receptor A3 n=1 Tax=Aquarana catesbeiana TaxID=8400 RepID=A0A2G9P2A7_AQUCT|nr:hypothetical protein AB205_0111970 [Aquarana catesbeiana]
MVANQLLTWPRTLAGITAYLLCTRYSAGGGIYPGTQQDEIRAWRRCDRGGSWAEEDYSKCQYANDVTRVLFMFNQNTVVEASIQLPAALFGSREKREKRAVDESVYKLQLIAFRNGKLFPATGNSTHLADDGKRRAVVTPVILVKLDGPNRNLPTIPVNITLRRIAHGKDPVAAQWDFDLLNGQGGWKSEGCQIIASDENVTTIQCGTLSNYAVLMDLTGTEFYTHPVTRLHPVVYASAVVLLLCLLMLIVSNLYYHGVVRISLKSWHMLVNLGLHIFFTCAVYVSGINQTRNSSVCQAIGILLHYSTLATVLWVGVTARNIYKQVTKKAKRCQDPDELPPPPRPMLRFYLIGGGIPIIVCGITAAANIKNYGSQQNAPYLGAFYGPASFIVFINCIIFIQLKRHPDRVFELKEQTEEQQRLAASESGEGNNPDSLSVSLVSTSALENEQTFQAQLLGVSLTLLLYVALWIFGALAVSLDYPMDLVFSCFFGVTCLSLGAFLVVHHCINREDLRRALISTFCPGRSTYSVQVNVPPSNSTATNGEAPKCTNSSAESSCTNKTASSVKNSSQVCKLTNLQAAAAQCNANSLPVNTAPQLDNSLTEHSIDNDIKMHVAPLEVQYRSNGHPSRHHKNRSKGHRSSRLTVLREYAYDVPTSVDGSVQNTAPRSRPSYSEGHSRSRRAYLAYRERHFNQCHQDSSDAGSTLPRYSRNMEKVVSSNHKKDILKEPIAVELESQQKSYGLNLAVENEPAKDEVVQELPINADSNGNVKTGLWKHETTV